MNNVMQGLLCICIPTFNRDVFVYKTVENILDVKDPRIRVLVQDNCSNDESIIRFNRITDTRFSLVRNTVNIGGAKNTILSLSHIGIAKYYLLMLDRDEFEISILIKLMKWLENNDLSIGRLNFKTMLRGTDNFRSHLVRNRSFSNFNLLGLYKLNHPSGWIFSDAFNILNKNLIDDFLKEDLLYPIESILLKAEYSSFFLYNVSSDLQISHLDRLAVVKSNYVIESKGAPFIDLNYLKQDLNLILTSLRSTFNKSLCIMNHALLYNEILYRIIVSAKKLYKNDTNMRYHYNLEKKQIKFFDHKENHRKLRLIFKNNTKYFYGYQKMLLHLLMFFVDIKIMLILVFPLLDKFFIHPIELTKLVFKKSFGKAVSL